MSAVTAACPTPCPAQTTAAQHHTAQEAPPCVHSSGPPGAAFPFRGFQPPRRGTVPPHKPLPGVLTVNTHLKKAEEGEGTPANSQSNAKTTPHTCSNRPS